jgi:hypothetical protein
MIATEPGVISADAVRRYVASTLGTDVDAVAMRRLGHDGEALDPKGFGYGVPFEVECVIDGSVRRFVLSRTRPAHGFGHDYAADRAWQALYGHEAYNTFPLHVRSADVGNLLFRERTDFSVLGRSRGAWGEPADDVAALGVNYLFFGIRALAGRGERGVAAPFGELFNVFLGSYMAASGDAEILETLPPFFVFRLLILAHPRWYPTLSDATRAELLGLARCMVTTTRFDPADVSWLCGEAQ